MWPQLQHKVNVRALGGLPDSLSGPGRTVVWSWRGAHNPSSLGASTSHAGDPPQLVGGGPWLCPQPGLLSVQDGLEQNQDNAEDLGNGPCTNKESSLESAARCSKEPSVQPAAISFLGALRIPVRSLGNGGKRELSRCPCWMSGDGGDAPGDRWLPECLSMRCFGGVANLGRETWEACLDTAFEHRHMALIATGDVLEVALCGWWWRSGEC